MGTTTLTPSLNEALRTLAGIDPTQAGTMFEAFKNTNLASIVDPLRQEKMAAQINEILARSGLTVAKTTTEGATLARKVGALEPATALKQQQTEALRIKNETVAQATADYLAQRIGP